MNNMKIISNEVQNKVLYGRIKIQTQIGELEYSYQTHDDPQIAMIDDDYQLESKPKGYKKLTNEEHDEIDDIIKNELYK